MEQSPPPHGSVPGQVESAEDGGSPPERGSSPSRSTGSGDRKKKNRRQKAEEARLRLAELQGRLHGLDAAEVELKKYRDKEEREEAATAAAYAALVKEQLELSSLHDGRWDALSHSGAGMKPGELAERKAADKVATDKAAAEKDGPSRRKVSIYPGEVGERTGTAGTVGSTEYSGSRPTTGDGGSPMSGDAVAMVRRKHTHNRHENQRGSGVSKEEEEHGGHNDDDSDFGSEYDPIEEAMRNMGLVRREPKNLEETVPNSLTWLWGGFSRRSPLRVTCFSIRKSARWAVFFFIVIICNSLHISLWPGIEEMRQAGTAPTSFMFEYGVAILEAIDVVAFIVLAFEVLIGTIALGVHGNETAYLNGSYFHVLDVTCLIFGVIEWLSRQFGFVGLTLRPFRLIRIFRAAARLEAFAGIKNIMLAMRIGSQQLITALGLLFAMLCAFSIGGQAIFQNSFARRCVTQDLLLPPCGSDFRTSWAPTCNISRFSLARGALGADLPTMQMGGLRVVAGGYPFEKWCKVIKNSTANQFDGEWPLDAKGRYHTCLEGQQCEVIGNPSFGFSHFDHFGGALPSMLQVVAQSGYQDILWRSIWSEPAVAVVTWFIYVISTILCTFLILNLFVAIVTGTFRRVRQSLGSAFEEVEREKMRDMQAAQRAAGRSDLPTTKILEDKAKIEKAEEEVEIDADGEKVLDAGLAMHYQAKRVIENRIFRYVTRVVILAHMIGMASKGIGISDFWQEFAVYADLGCTIWYIGETVMGMFAAQSVSDWFQSSFNKFEFLMTLLGITGLAIPSPVVLLIPAFRVFRLMAIFPTLQALLLASVASVQAILNVLVFVLIIAFSYAVAGRWVFLHTMDEITRSNFGTFTQAMLTVFQLMLGDSWSDVMYSAMQSSPNLGWQVFSALFILSWYIFSMTIVNNLFVAVIIENFEVSQTIESIGRPGRFSQARQMLTSSYSKIADLSRKGLFKKAGGEDEAQAQFLDDKKQELFEEIRKAKLNKVVAETDGVTVEDLNPVEIKIQRKVINTPLGRMVQKCVAGAWVEELEQTQETEDKDEPERSLFVFLPNDPFRRLCVSIGNMVVFDIVIYSSIGVSCFFLMVTPPAEDLPGDVPIVPFVEMVRWNQVFTFLFLFEAIVRIVSDGLYFTRTAYLKSGWNIIDFTVLTLSLVDEFGLLQGDGGTAKVIRMGRALKPLRLMKRNQGMRQVIDALISTMMPVAYVVLFSLFNYFTFAIIGVGLFAGNFSRCSTPRADYPLGHLECVGGYPRLDDGVLVPSAWINPINHFDSFGDAVVTLFRVNTFKYVEILYASMDATPDVNQSPLEDSHRENCLFLVTYLIIGGLFCMNLFVGFVVDGFNNSRGATEIELQYTKTVRQFSVFRPRYDYFSPPPYRFNVALRAFAESTTFQTFSAVCVSLNVIFLLMDHADPVQAFTDFMLVQTWIFFLELAFEVLLFLVAYGPGSFVDDLWKAFDLFVTVSGGLGLMSGDRMLTLESKAFRLLRIIRLMRMVKPVRVILETLVQSLPQVMNILLLLFLVYSMFAVVAVQVFGTTKYGVRLGPTANFESYPYAMATIWETIGGDEWFELMYDTKVQWPECTPVFAPNDIYDYEGPAYSFGDCGSAIVSNPYFFATILIGKHVMLTLFIGMILDNFSFILDQVGSPEDKDWKTGASPEQMQEVTDCFKLFDNKKATLSIYQLPALLAAMPRPIGFRDHGHSIDPCFEKRKTFEGEVRLETHERRRKIKPTNMDLASAMMIKAELNVIVNEQRRVEDVKRYMGWTRFFVKAPGLDKATLVSRIRNEEEVEQIDFETYLLTVLHWRMPHKVPLAVKIIRYRRLDEVIRTVQTLVVRNSFSRLLALRVQRTVQHSIKGRVDRYHWEGFDEHAQARRLRTRDEISTAKADAANFEVSVGLLLRKPTGMVLAKISPIREIPSNMLEHRVSVLRWSRDQGVQLRHGSMGFKAMQSMLKTHDVVVQRVEPHIQAQHGGGMYQIALEEASFKGWGVVPHHAEEVFSPQTLMNNVPTRYKTDPIQWERIDCWEGDRLFGSLLDVQTWLEAPQKGVTGMQSVVRLNMGTHYYASEKMRVYQELKHGHLETAHQKKREATQNPEEQRQLSRSSSRRSSGIPQLISSRRVSFVYAEAEPEEPLEASLQVLGYVKKKTEEKELVLEEVEKKVARRVEQERVNSAVVRKAPLLSTHH